MHLWSSQKKEKKKKPQYKHKVTLAKLRAKKEVLAHLKINLAGSSVVVQEAAVLWRAQRVGIKRGGHQSRTMAGAAL